VNDWTIPAGYELAFIFTLILLGFYALFFTYLGLRIKIERASIEKTPMALLYAIFLEIILLFASRLIYCWFDFVLTRFDTSTYTYYPNLFFFRLGAFLEGISLIIIAFAVEHVILLKRTRYAFTIIMIIAIIFGILYPMRPGILEDFAITSLIGAIAMLIVCLFILFTWVWLGIVTPGLRKIMWILCIGVILWIFGESMVGEPYINFFLLFLSRDVTYAISITIKIAGLLGFFYGIGMNFRRVNKATLDYYRSRKICIVHRGKIQGTPFMCAKCGVLYCAKCKEAVVRAENKCWNCKAMLDTSSQISFQVRADDAMFQKFANFKDELSKETDLEAFRILLEIGDFFLEQRKNQGLGDLAGKLEEIITMQPHDEIDAIIKDSIAEPESPVIEGESSPRKAKIDTTLLIDGKRK